jgi:hypothetical protein
MKKLLMISLGVFGLCSIESQAVPPSPTPSIYTAVNASPFKMAKTYQKSDSSMIQFDQRRVNSLVQRTASYARDGIIAVLAAAENEGFGTDLDESTGYNQVGGVENLRKVIETSFIGLANTGVDTGSTVIDASGAIQFVLDPSEIDPGIGIGRFSVTYYPVLEGSGADGSVYTGTTDQYIDGWTCVTTASTETRLGRGHVAHSQDTVEPLFMGLGYPFELCTVVNQTPVLTEVG